MISNERVQALIATDRPTLIALMAAAHANGAWRGATWDVYHDPDIRSLMDAAIALNREPATLTPPHGWQKQGDRR
jgi:hypothetical protein